MSGVSSTTALCKIGKQASKGTPVNTGLICGMLTQSGFFPDFDELDDLNEHGCRTVSTDRATVHKTAMDRAGYVVRGNLRGYLYPRLIGLMLVGAGFTPTTTTVETGVYQHVFKLSTRAAHKWLTVLSKIGDRTLRATDARVNSLAIDANTRGVNWTAGLLAITTDDAPGSETGTEEALVKILPSTGSLTIMDGATEIVNTATDSLLGLSLNIANPLDDADQSLFAFTRADLPQQGVDITGQVTGLELDYTTYYDLLVYGGGSDPAASVAVLDINYKWESAVEITTGNPYSLEIDIPAAEVTLNDFNAEGNNIVRWDFSYRMIDNSTDPIAITLINDVATY